MNDHGDAQSVESPAREFRSIDGCGRRKLLAVHMREIDASTLDHVSVRDDSSSASASSRPLPHILGQFRRGVLGQEFAQDSILQCS